MDSLIHVHNPHLILTQPIQLINETINHPIHGLDLVSLVLLQGPVAGTLSPAATVDCAGAIRAYTPRVRPAYRATLCWAFWIVPDSLPEKTTPPT
jgi:hypothetical protein